MKGILLGDDGDLLVNVRRDSEGKITQGLVIGDVTGQNQRSILLAQKGEIKEYPLTGVGIATFLDDEDIDGLTANARSEFVKDGQKVKKIVYDDGKLIIDAEYK